MKRLRLGRRAPRHLAVVHVQVPGAEELQGMQALGELALEAPAPEVRPRRVGGVCVCLQEHRFAVGPGSRGPLYKPIGYGDMCCSWGAPRLASYRFPQGPAPIMSRSCGSSCFCPRPQAGVASIPHPNLKPKLHHGTYPTRGDPPAHTHFLEYYDDMLRSTSMPHLGKSEYASNARNGRDYFGDHITPSANECQRGAGSANVESGQALSGNDTALSGAELDETSGASVVLGHTKG